MSRLYSIWKKTFRDKEGNVKQKYYASPRRMGLLTTKSLCRRIVSASSLTEGDFMSSIILIASELEEALLAGYSVKIDGIGTFGVGVSSKGVDDPKQLNPKHLKVTRITFQADRELSRRVKNASFSLDKYPKNMVTKEDIAKEGEGIN